MRSSRRSIGAFTWIVFGPRSITKPATWSVRSAPPGRSPASTTKTSCMLSCSSSAAARPAIPAPTTTAPTSAALTSDRPAEDRPSRALLLGKVGVEDHRHVAHEQAAECGQHEAAIRLEREKAVADGRSQRCELACEALAEHAALLAVEFGRAQLAVTQDASDDPAPRQIVRREDVPAHGREAVLAHGLMPRLEVAMRLRIAAAQLADRARSEAEQIDPGLRGVAHEVAAQRSLHERLG